MTYNLDWLEANLEDMEALTAACSMCQSSLILRNAILMVRSERQQLDELARRANSNNSFYKIN